MLVDYYSRYIEIAYIRTPTTQSVILKMKDVFARWGVPDTVISDNGPQFASREFSAFATSALLQYAVGCLAYLFSVVGSFRVIVLADAESVFFVVVFCHFRENGNRWCSDKLNKHTLIYSIVV